MIRALVPLLLLLLLLNPTSSTAAVRDFAVEVSASVQESPPRIDLAWPVDPSAAEYRVLRKISGEPAWGEPVAILPGSAGGYSDPDVLVGVAYEYALRKTWGYVEETLTVEPGRSVVFTVYDGWGDGICCQHGLGWYRVTGDGSVLAAGGEFGGTESTAFTVGASGELLIEMVLDAFPPETTWRLTADGTGEILAQGGPYESARFGHICAGIHLPALEDPGTVLILLSEELREPLSDELDRLGLDLVAEGFRVRWQEITPELGVSEVKALVLEACAAEPTIRSLLILGHVPVPYSGNLTGVHTNHHGAWPADLHYGDLDGLWTDETVENTTSAWPENHNIPGDGKFDQTFLPSEVELQVGRVDLSRLPAFPLDEIELMRRYLDRNHAFRRGEIRPERRGLVDDHVGESDGLAFAAVGWRNFTALCGPGSVHALDYFGTLEEESYLWSYGCGGGSNTSCAGVGRTADFAGRTVRTVFTALYGSYFGDWDKPDNLLRAPLASPGWPLVCFWAGRPTWHLHHMGLGSTIGHAVRLSQNNDHEYTVHDGQRQIYIALMGDPTLRLLVAQPAADLQLRWEGSGVRLTWSPSPDAGEGYRVDRAPASSARFQRISPEPVMSTTFLDPSPLPGRNVYRIRALELETSGSGTYLNPAPGVLGSIQPELGVRIEVAPNPVHPGDEFGISGFLENPGAPLEDVPVFFVLDVHGSYYFWPSWIRLDPPEAPDLDFRLLEVPTGILPVEVIPPFPWPDTGAQEDSGLLIHGALLNPAMDAVIGGMASVEWGYSSSPQ